MLVSSLPVHQFSRRWQIAIVNRQYFYGYVFFVVTNYYLTLTSQTGASKGWGKGFARIEESTKKGHADVGSPSTNKNSDSMLTLTKSHTLENLEWQFLSEKLQASETLAKIVLTAWQMGLWLAKILVEQQLAERAHQSTSLGNCAKCGSRLQSKGFVNRRMLTLVGWVQWRRRVGRCPNRCAGSHNTPFDAQLGIAPYQQTSTELMRLGCLRFSIDAV
jgi:hypothetical protein